MKAFLLFFVSSTLYLSIISTLCSAVIYGVLWSGGGIALLGWIILDLVVRCVLYALAEWRGFQLFKSL